MTLAESLAAAARGSAVGPVEERTVLRVGGADAPAYLHRLCTQELLRLQPFESAQGAFLDSRGCLVGDALILRRVDDLVVLGPRAARQGLIAHLRKYVVMSKVVVEDLSDAFHCLPVLGPAGLAAVRAEPGGAILLGDPLRGAPALDLLLSPASAGSARAGLLAAGAADLSAEALEALRILAGVPRYGADVDGSRIAIEALPGAAFSFDKGCYLGQEVVQRGTVRGQVQRGLVQLALPPGAGPGAPLGAEGKEVGAVTSAAETPEGRVGLGTLRRAYWAAGTRLTTGAGEAVVRRALTLEREGS